MFVISIYGKYFSLAMCVCVCVQMKRSEVCLHAANTEIVALWHFFFSSSLLYFKFKSLGISINITVGVHLESRVNFFLHITHINTHSHRHQSVFPLTTIFLLMFLWLYCWYCTYCIFHFVKIVEYFFLNSKQSLNCLKSIFHRYFAFDWCCFFYCCKIDWLSTRLNGS